MRTSLVFGWALASVLLPTLVACGDNDANPSPDADSGEAQGDNGDNGGHRGDAGSDPSVVPPPGTVPVPPPGCPVEAFPNSDDCVITEALGVFVSLAGREGDADGTRARPFTKIAPAVELAAKTGRRVYVCAATYKEAITVKNGVSMFGYFDCANGWSVGTSKARIEAPTSPAIVAKGIDEPTRIEGFDVRAPSFATAAAAGSKAQSSIGLLAVDATVQFVSGTVVAGAGQPGAPGTAAPTLTRQVTQTQVDGTGPVVCVPPLGSSSDPCSRVVRNPNGERVTCMLPGNAPASPELQPGPGGNGGYGGVHRKSTECQTCPRERIYLDEAPGAGGGGTPATARGGAPLFFDGRLLGIDDAVDGASGGNGEVGASGAAFGALSVDGYAPSDGRAGTHGRGGQGGGGGAGNAPAPEALPMDRKVLGLAGGGGGAGGCPGLAGGAGGGGGASIAVLSVRSRLAFEDAGLEAAVGGRGGAAGTWSAPSDGGLGARAALGGANRSGTGARGGRGGAAGASGSGGGGPSIVLAVNGENPVLTRTTLKKGKAGEGVAASPGVLASPAGIEVERYDF
jgi:hypothetical protein